MKNPTDRAGSLSAFILPVSFFFTYFFCFFFGAVGEEEKRRRVEDAFGVTWRRLAEPRCEPRSLSAPGTERQRRQTVLTRPAKKNN